MWLVVLPVRRAHLSAKTLYKQPVTVGGVCINRLARNSVSRITEEPLLWKGAAVFPRKVVRGYFLLTTSLQPASLWQTLPNVIATNTCVSWHLRMPEWCREGAVSLGEVSCRKTNPDDAPIL